MRNQDLKRIQSQIVNLQKMGEKKLKVKFLRNSLNIPESLNHSKFITTNTLVLKSLGLNSLIDVDLRA